MSGQYSNLYFEQFNNLNGLSNNRVYSISQDKRGFLWIGTLDGLNRYDGYTFKQYKSNPENRSSRYIHNNRIVKIFADKNGFIWLGTEKNGVECFNPYSEEFYHYPPVENDSLSILNGDVQEFKEVNDTLIVKCTGGVWRFDKENNEFKTFAKEHKLLDDDRLNYFSKEIKRHIGLGVEVYSYLIEADSTAWVGTRRNGLFIKQNDRWRHYTRPPFDASFQVRTIFQDCFGTVWIGTRNNGLFKHNPATRIFKHFNYYQEGSDLVYDLTVRAITEDVNRDIWIGTYNKGLLKFNRKTGGFRKIRFNSGNPESDKIRSLFTDKNGDIWVGSYAGIWVLTANGKVKFSFHAEDDNINKDKPYTSSRLNTLRTYGIADDFFNNIWIAGWNELSCYNVRNKTFTHYPASFFGVKNIRKVYVDNNNTVWVGCEFGGLIQFNAVNESFERYYPGKSNNNLVCENVFDICESNKQHVWITTFNGVDRFDRKSGTFKHYFSNQGLSGNMVYGVLEDQSNNLWFTTTNGISEFSTVTNQFTNFDTKSGLMTYEYAEGGCFKSKYTGEFIVGGINGFQLFNPDSIKRDTITPKPVITEIRVNNELIEPGDIYKLYSKKIDGIDSELTLREKDKIVTVEFSGIQYLVPEKNKYRYKLQGFDSDWIYANSFQRSATYTNLWPGEYYLQIQAANGSHIWSKVSFQLKIVVLPPFWLTWWALGIYLVLIVLTLALFRYYTIKKAAAKNAIELERIKYEEAEQLSRSKLNFFTSISQEFRTPLSLIVAPMAKIMEAPLNTPIKNYYRQLKLIGKNAERLQELTNQVLELRKLERGEQKINVSRVLIGSFVKSILSQFDEVLTQKGVLLEFVIFPKEIEAFLDVEMMERIVNILLSNALKFTDESVGTIAVRINRGIVHPDESYAFSVGELRSSDFFELSVEDNGIGIDPELIDKIFNRFYQVNSDKNVGVQGAGIGLTLLKELVLLHNGQVLVRSMQGEGSLFTLRFPLNASLNNENNNTELVSKVNSQSLKSTKLASDEATLDDEIEIKQGRKNILIVEEHKELLQYIQKELSDRYNILSAADGRSGVKIAFDERPDLIISDVVLPQMSGIELCKRIKNDIRTCHIPVALLTALSTEEDRKDGYNALADEYITKPFKIAVLKASIKRLIVNRDKVKEAFINGEMIDPVKPAPTLDPLEDEFIQKLNSYLDHNISDLSLSVESISAALGISRSSLHNKLKSVTGQSATEYIRSYKVNKAVTLLEEKRYSVLEIAYQTGFNSSSYFIKCFKNKYGVTPKEFMEKV